MYETHPKDGRSYWPPIKTSHRSPEVTFVSFLRERSGPVYGDAIQWLSSGAFLWRTTGGCGYPVSRRFIFENQVPSFSPHRRKVKSDLQLAHLQMSRSTTFTTSSTWAVKDPPRSKSHVREFSRALYVILYFRLVLEDILHIVLIHDVHVLTQCMQKLWNINDKLMWYTLEIWYTHMCTAIIVRHNHESSSLHPSGPS